MTFEWPFALVGILLVPALLLAYAWMQTRRKKYAVRFTNVSLLSEVVGRGPGLRRHIPAAFFLAALAALLIGLARPTMVIALPKERAGVMLVMDVSGSMAANDMQPTRLEAAKQAARKFVQGLPEGARVGLVVFNHQANVLAPLTENKTAVMRAIDGLRAEGGTAIGEGLSAALEQIGAPSLTTILAQQKPVSSTAPIGQVVLLSDGESDSGIAPADAAAQAAQQRVQVFTVGVGKRGSRVALANVQRSVGLDEGTLKRMADMTGGQYFYAQESAELDRIYAQLSSSVSVEEQRQEVTVLFVLAAVVALIVAGVLSLFWFQRLP